MLLRLLLLFTVLPLVEFWLLVDVIGGRIGFVPTVLLVLATGALGATLTRQQGLATLSRIQRQLASGEAPTDALVDGAMILLAGAVLITPGVLTDIAGFALLAPPVRAVLKPWLRAWFMKRVRVQQTGASFVWTNNTERFSRPPQGGNIVDVEVNEVRTKSDGAA